MSFTSFQFFLFLSAMVAVQLVLHNHFRARKAVLLVGSYYFYACWDWRFVLFLLVTTIVNYAAVRAISGSSRSSIRRIWLGLTLLVGLGSLAYFKYANFLIQSASDFLQFLNFNVDIALMKVVLPVGISFYTLQSLSHVIDVYRNSDRPARSVADFALFVAFFPTLLAGPITRGHQLLPQFERELPQSQNEVEVGLTLIVRGLVKKIAFADVLAQGMVNAAFSSPSDYSPIFLLVALYAYTFQIYMDVSGYTDIARGAASLCGFVLPTNFRRPYLADSVSNFWQRWHISVSSFFRDYVFFSLGGSRSGHVYTNLMLTFLAIGLWHGGSFSFLLYGALHGAMVCFDRWRRQQFEGRGELISNTLAIFLTFHFVVLSRVLFRASDLGEAWAYLKAIGNPAQVHAPWHWLPLLALAIAAALHWGLPDGTDNLFQRVARLGVAKQAAAIAVVTWLLIALSGSSTTFVYYGF